ncbi:MAG: hypothetical protein NVS9B8_07450 [Candidatus Limnocylindrales bacterium]
MTLVFLASCAGGPQRVGITPGPVAAGAVATGLATFGEGGLVFSYPATWRLFHHTATSSFSWSIADLATVDVPDPCITTQDVVGASTTCADRFRLEPNSLVVHVGGGGAPGIPIFRKPAAATALTVDAMPAFFETLPPDEAAVGADESLVWTLSRPSSVDNFVELHALVRGPDLALLTGQLQALVSSIRYDPPVMRLPTSTGERDAAIGKALDSLARTSAAWRCFPHQIGSAVGVISEYPDGPALAAPHRATCRTTVEATALQLWRATFTITLDTPDPIVGGIFAVEVWIAPDGTPGSMTSGSTVP